MLVALLAVFLLGASGTSTLFAAFDHAQELIKTQIEDPSRRKELTTVIEDAEKSMKGALKGRGKTTQELVALLRSYEAGAGDMQPVLQRLRAEGESAQEQVIRYRFEVKAKMSREEWAKVFPAANASR